MDGNNASSCRRLRARLAPCLESLEGRRLLSGNNAGQVTISEGLSQGTPTLLVLGTNKADVINITDNGSGAAGNITVTLGNGGVYTSKSAVTEIEVMGMGGNDQVSYTLTGPLVAERIVLVDLGAGNDQFTANINGAVDNMSGLDLEAYGDAGNDVMTINQSGEILEGTFIPYLDGGSGNDTLTYNGTGPVNGGATLNPALAGDAGNDTITSDYSGTIDGTYVYNLTIDGGSGNDNIADDIFVGPGSTGVVGSNATSPAVVNGGSGNDKIHFAIDVDPTANQAQIAAAVNASTGHDTVEQTANVMLEGNPAKDTTISPA